MNIIVRRTLMGIILIVLGVLRYKGKNFTRKELSTFRYHKVTNENKRLYAKQSGKDLIIFGSTFIIGNIIYELYNETIACIILIVGLITYIGMDLNAFYKYIKRKY